MNAKAELNLSGSAAMILSLIAMVTIAILLVHNSNVAMEARSYQIDKLERLNRSLSGAERAQFKEFERCYYENRTYVGYKSSLWLNFDEALANKQFRENANVCLNEMLGYAAGMFHNCVAYATQLEGLARAPYSKRLKS